MPTFQGCHTAQCPWPKTLTEAGTCRYPATTVPLEGSVGTGAQGLWGRIATVYPRRLCPAPANALSPRGRTHLCLIPMSCLRAFVAKRATFAFSCERRVDRSGRLRGLFGSEAYWEPLQAYQPLPEAFQNSGLPWGVPGLTAEHSWGVCHTPRSDPTFVHRNGREAGE